MSSQSIIATAIFALLGTGLAAADGTRSAAVAPPVRAVAPMDPASGSDAKCEVQVVRNGTPGMASITRLAKAGGSCLCTVTTGPAKTNGPAEGIVKGLLSSGKCDGAPPPGETPSAFAPGPSLLPLVAVPLGAAGAAVAGDSPG